MIDILKLDIYNIQFSDVVVPRPAGIPYNRITHPKVYAAGYANGLLVMVFKTKEGKPDRAINYFRLVNKKTVDGVCRGEKEWIDFFLTQSLNGIYPCSTEIGELPFI